MIYYMLVSCGIWTNACFTRTCYFSYLYLHIIMKVIIRKCYIPVKMYNLLFQF